MSILSDTEIKHLCLPPTFVVTEKVHDYHQGSVSMYPKTVETFSYLSEEEIMLKMQDRLKPTAGRRMYDQHSLGVVSYRKLTETELSDFKPMISPYSSESVKTTPEGKKIPSWGSSSYGYDIRIGRNFKLFTKPADEPLGPVVIDVCDFAATEEYVVEDHNDVDYIVIPPHGFALGHSVEYINMPEQITSICMGKSSIARTSLHMCITPLECGWSGHVTIELENMSDYPIRLHSGIGISQLLFFRGEQPCAVSYSDRNGKYQNQPALPVTAK